MERSTLHIDRHNGAAIAAAPFMTPLGPPGGCVEYPGTPDAIIAALRESPPAELETIFRALGATMDGRKVRTAKFHRDGHLVLAHRVRNPGRTHVFKSPTGGIVSFKRVSEFATYYGLTASGVYAVLAGRLKSIHGWTDLKAPLVRVGWQHKLRDPQGVVHEVVPTLAAFCRQNGLTPQSVCTLPTGRLKKHKGWTLVL